MHKFIEDSNNQHFKNPTLQTYFRFAQKMHPDNFELIDVEQMSYSKKLAIIYNPNSGRKIDRKAQISNALDKNSIKYEFLETKGYLDALNFVKNLDIDTYSAIVAVGGDGTCHEVVNGLMQRTDRRKLPICFLPGGTGNDTCRSLNMDSMETGLQYLLKGNTIKMDIFRALLDHETEADVYKRAAEGKIKLNDCLRYSVVNTSLLLVGLTAKNAAPMKAYLGSTAYTISCINEIFKCVQGHFDFELDDGKHCIRNVDTQFLSLYNGKTGGGGIFLNPIGMINDGYMELVYHDIITVSKAISLFIRPGGIMFYDPGFTCYRCRNAKIINKKKNSQGTN